MRILGIDPGSTQSAFCQWDGEKIIGADIIPNERLREHLSRGLDTMPSDSVFACEHIQCMGMAVGKTVFETAYFIGELRGLVVHELGLKFIPVYRSEVKLHFCNSMRAKDSNIRQALIDRFGAPGKKASPGLTYGLKGDLWSAFAIAVMVKDKQL